MRYLEAFLALYAVVGLAFAFVLSPFATDIARESLVQDRHRPLFKDLNDSRQRRVLFVSSVCLVLLTVVIWPAFLLDRERQ